MRDADITVLVVDDSALTRRAVRSVLQDAGYRVVGEAHDGGEAVDMVVRMRPSVVTMDLEMPNMDGLQAIEQIMARAPTPILVLSGEPRFRGTCPTFEALSRGALELLPKPTSWPGTPAEQEQLVAMVRQAATVPVLPHYRAHREARRRARSDEQEVPKQVEAPGVVLLGASTGGPRVLRRILSELPADFPFPILGVQHLAETFVSTFVEWLDDGSDLIVREPNTVEKLEPGVALIAVRGPHLLVAPNGRVQRSEGQQEDAHVPGIDELFSSAAEVLGDRAVAVLLSGMGRDGAAGLKAIADAGGSTLAQDEASSVVYGMPRAALDLGAVEAGSSVEAIVDALKALAPSAGSGD